MSPILMNKRLKLKENELEQLRSQSKEIKNTFDDIKKRAEKVQSEKELEKLEEESKVAESLREENKTSISQIENELQELRSKIEKSKKGAGEKMKTNDFESVENRTDTKKAEIRKLQNYMLKRGKDEKDLVTDDYGALIPQQILYTLKPDNSTSYDLSQYVNVLPVTNPGGKYYVEKTPTDTLKTQKEFEDSEKLEKPGYREITWNVDTRRGYLSYSMEAMQDVAQFENFLQRQVNRKIINTKNAMIVSAIKEAEAQEVTDFDGIKDVLDFIDPVYQNVKVYLSLSAFNYLNKLKDKNGNYLFENDVKSVSGKSIQGVEVVKISDALIGKGYGFVGDLKEYATYFDRLQVSLGWDTQISFSQQIGVAIRSDLKITDKNAGSLIAIKDLADTQAKTTSNANSESKTK